MTEAGAREDGNEQSRNDGGDRPDQAQQQGKAAGTVPPSGHYSTVRFEITTMPLSVTVKRFLSSSGK